MKNTYCKCSILLLVYMKYYNKFISKYKILRNIPILLKKQYYLFCTLKKLITFNIDKIFFNIIIYIYQIYQ